MANKKGKQSSSSLIYSWKNLNAILNYPYLQKDPEHQLHMYTTLCLGDKVYLMPNSCISSGALWSLSSLYHLQTRCERQQLWVRALQSQLHRAGWHYEWSRAAEDTYPLSYYPLPSPEIHNDWGPKHIKSFWTNHLQKITSIIAVGYFSRLAGATLHFTIQPRNVGREMKYSCWFQAPILFEAVLWN